MSSGRITLTDSGGTGTFVNPFIDWSASVNTSNNTATVTAVFKAYTTGTQNTFGNFSGGITIAGNRLPVTVNPLTIVTGGSGVVTTIGSHSVSGLALNTNGSGSWTVSADGGIPGTSWTATSGSGTASVDWERVPTTPAAPTLARSNNGATLTITGAEATFFGSTPVYDYRVSRDGGSNWYTSGTLNSSRQVAISVTNTDSLVAQTRARDSEGNGSYSASSTSSIGVPAAPGAAPTLTRTSDGTSITLTSATATRATAYSYRQSTDGVNWVAATVEISSGTSVTITGLVYDQTYFYQTLGRNSTGFGNWSATASIAGAPPAFVNPEVASPAVWGQLYTSQALTVANRAREFSIVASPNNLPTGLLLNTSTGVITGAVTATNPFSFTFKIRATNNAGSVETSDRTITVISPVRVASATGPTGSLVTGAVNVNTATGPTGSFKTGIVRVWNGSIFAPSRLT
jgi:hypothetical protein